MYNKFMSDSIFTKIIKGEIPSHKIYEDDKTYAFLDIHPIVAGQALVVPKKQVGFVWDLDEDDYRAVMETTKKAAKRLREVTGAKYVGVKIEGVDVSDHAHVKLYPFNTVTEYNRHPDMTIEPDHAALAEMAQKLAF